MMSHRNLLLFVHITLVFELEAAIKKQQIDCFLCDSDDSVDIELQASELMKLHQAAAITI